MTFSKACHGEPPGQQLWEIVKQIGQENRKRRADRFPESYFAVMGFLGQF